MIKSANLALESIETFEITRSLHAKNQLLLVRMSSYFHHSLVLISVVRIKHQIDFGTTMNNPMVKMPCIEKYRF